MTIQVKHLSTWDLRGKLTDELQKLHFTASAFGKVDAVKALLDAGYYKDAAEIENGFGLEDAFRLTQNLDQSWLKNDGVHPVPALLEQGGARSTCVGDIMIDDKGVTWVVAMAGFTQLD